MSKDQNFINQIKLFLDNKSHDKLKFILDTNLDLSHLSNQDFYIVCFAHNVIKNFTESNKLISLRKNKLDDFKLKKKFLRLEIFNYFFLKDFSKLRPLVLSNLELGFDPEIIKIFYLSLKNINDYSVFLDTVLTCIRKHPMGLKDASLVINFLQQNNELFILTCVLQKLVKLRLADKPILHNLAVSFFSLKKYYLANKYFEKLLKINSINETILSLVNINNILRNKNKSKDYLKMALHNNPNDCKALYLEQEINTLTSDINLTINRLEKILQKKNIIPLVEKEFLILALAKLYEKNKNYKKSFEYIELFNFEKNLNINFDISQIIKESNFFLDNFSNKNLFSKIQNKTTTDKKKIPIFILGLPRSGTTLIEHILGSHHNVQHFGERDTFFKNFKFLFDVYNLENNNTILQNLSNEDYLSYGDFYKKQFGLQSGKFFFTDKMPFNFFYIGLIKHTLPEAKIIYCKRDYKDVGLSIYKNFFGENVSFAYNKKNIIDYITQFHSTMKSWLSVYNKDIFQIDYNELILKPEAIVSDLLNYCDLPWDNACLEFYNKKLIADTVSLMQVSNPIYDNSVGSWKNYYEFSKDFFDSLDRIK